MVYRVRKQILIGADSSDAADEGLFNDKLGVLEIHQLEGMKESIADFFKVCDVNN